jgi:hypothetical protein
MKSPPCNSRHFCFFFCRKKEKWSKTTSLANLPIMNHKSDMKKPLKIGVWILLVAFLFNCENSKVAVKPMVEQPLLPETYLIILGTAQDAGYP